MEDIQMLEKIVKRLDLIISIELDRNAGPDGMRIVDKISILNERGLPAAEIADIVGKPTNQVTGAICKRKKIKAKAVKN